MWTVAHINRIKHKWILSTFPNNHDDQGEEEQGDEDAGDDEIQAGLLLGGLVALLEDVDDGMHLISEHVGGELGVALACEVEIALGAVDVAIVGQMFGEEEQRGLVHHGAADIIEGRLAEPVAGHIVIAKMIEHHGAIEACIGALVGVLLDHLEPSVADAQGVLEMALGSIDVHLEMEPLFAAFGCHHHHGVAVEVLQVEIGLAHGLALGIGCHLAREVHPRDIIGHKAFLTECCPIDKMELLERLNLHARVGTLKGEQGTEQSGVVRTMEGLGEADAQLGIMDGGVVLIGAIETEEPLDRAELALRIGRRAQAVATGGNLLLVIGHELGRLADGLVDLLIECLEIDGLLVGACIL